MAALCSLVPVCIISIEIYANYIGAMQFEVSLWPVYLIPEAPVSSLVSEGVLPSATRALLLIRTERFAGWFQWAIHRVILMGDSTGWCQQASEDCILSIYKHQASPAICVAVTFLVKSLIARYATVPKRTPWSLEILIVVCIAKKMPHNVVTSQRMIVEQLANSLILD